MSGPKFRSLGVVLLAIVCAAVLGVTSMLMSAFVFGVRTLLAEVALLTDEGWIMGGTDNPVPDAAYISAVENLYLTQFPGYSFFGLETPEQFCPIQCVSVPGSPGVMDNFGQSVNAGVSILDQTIRTPLTQGNEVAVFGYSQSATIATQEMNNLIANAGTAGYPTLAELQNNLHVVLVGDPNSPIGGILDRYQFPDGFQAFSLTSAPQHLPFLDVPLSMAPTPTEIPTDIYTAEYDGWADWPQGQLDVLGDINAGIGIATVHPNYPDPASIDFTEPAQIGQIGATTFYEIPQELPIVQWMYDGGGAGQFFGDVFSPWLRLIIDWGYGNAGDPAVDGLFTVPSGSPYDQTVGFAGGPWAETPYGTLWNGSGVAGLFEKMDPLQVLAGIQNAGIQSIVGPTTDILHDIYGTNLPPTATDFLGGLTIVLQNITGYDLVNLVDQTLLTGWTDVVNLLQGGLNDVGLNALNLASIIGPAAVFDGPLIAGGAVIDLVGDVFNIFNFFGA